MSRVASIVMLAVGIAVMAQAPPPGDPGKLLPNPAVSYQVVGAGCVGKFATSIKGTPGKTYVVRIGISPDPGDEPVYWWYPGWDRNVTTVAAGAAAGLGTAQFFNFGLPNVQEGWAVAFLLIDPVTNTTLDVQSVWLPK